MRSRPLLALLLCLVTAFAGRTALRADPLDPVLVILNSEPQVPVKDDLFGASLAPIDSSYLLIGAPADDPINENTGMPVSNAGSVYVVDRTNGAVLRSIRNPNLAAGGDQFGAAIAVVKPAAGGKLFAVGAPLFDGTAANSGVVYVFDADSDAEPLRLLPDVSRFNAQFGAVVAALGAYVVVGVPQDSVTGVASAGTVFIFKIEKTPGGIYIASRTKIENPLPRASDRFGASIALLDTGGEPDVVVGTPGYDSSTAGVPDAGRVYVQRGASTRLIFEPPLPSTAANFGAAVTVRAHEIVAGAPGFDLGAGRVYTFDALKADSEPGAHIPTSTVDSPDAAAGARFGSALSASATVVAVGAPRAAGPDDRAGGKVYLFSPVHVVSIPNPHPEDNDQFGSRLAWSGADVIIGAPGDQLASGAVFLYSAAGMSLLEVENPEAPTLYSTNNFGSALASIRRGSDQPEGWDLAIGASLDPAGGFSGAGSAYLYDAHAGTLLLKMPNPHPIANAFFGAAVGAVDRPSDDLRGGQDIVVGAMRNNVRRSPTVVNSSEPGAAYLYDASRRGVASNADSVFLHPEMPSMQTDVEHYGAQVFGIDDKIIISSMFGNTRAPDAFGRVGYGGNLVTNTGAVFVLDRNDPDNAYPPVIQDPRPQPQSQFGGNSVQSIAPVPRHENDPRGPGFDLLISAALYDDGLATNAGRAYLFDGLTDDMLLTIENPTPATQEMFGTTVAAMGTRLVIGAPEAIVNDVRAGAVYVFDGWDGPGGFLALENPFPETNDRFGAALIVRGDDIFVGSPGDSDPDGSGPIDGAEAAGAVFVFDGRDGGLLATLRNPDPDDPSSSPGGSHDNFGAFLAPLGGRFAVSAPADDLSNPDGTMISSAGAVYLYDWDSVGPVMTLAGPQPDPTTVTLECCTAFVEPGFTAYDERPLALHRAAALQAPIDLTSAVIVSGTVDSATPGTYRLTYTVEDPFGNRTAVGRTVRVVDTAAPVIASATPSVDRLWPPNGAMVPVVIAVVASDTVDSTPNCSISAVTSSEPVNGGGDGNTTPDWQFDPDSLIVNLRQERSGGGTGRIYTVTVACSDDSGNTASKDTSVAVRH